MYDELKERCRACSQGCIYPSKCSYFDKPPLKCMRQLLSEAADAIEELQKAVYFHKYNSEFWEDKYNSLADEKWIPVTERLPKEGEFALVYGDLYPNKHDGGVIAVSKRVDWNYWQGFGRERDITHWMPLPEPPKEET